MANEKKSKAEQDAEIARYRAYWHGGRDVNVRGDGSTPQKKKAEPKKPQKKKHWTQRLVDALNGN